jgi:pyrroloquinoline quinone (PQQ) biosynthesis protein C
MSQTLQLQDIRFKRDASVAFADHEAVITHLGYEYRLDGAAAQLLRKVAPWLETGADSAELADAAGAPVAAVEQLALALSNNGVVALRRPHEREQVMSGSEFYEYHRKYAAYWLQPIYQHPFWAKVVEGRATRAQVIGFAFEKYHYIEGAHEHMAIAAANATPEMLTHLARHFIEEYRHGDIYRRGLHSLFPDELVLEAPPLPTTRALVNFLNEAAATNSFGYYAANEFLQMTENTDEGVDDNAVNEFYAGMKKHYPYTGKLIESFIIHTKLDQNLGHDDVFAQMCRDVPPLSTRDVQSVMNLTRSVAERLMVFMDGIDRFYAAFPQMPRRVYALGAA